MKKLLSFKHWQLFLLIFICGAWISPSPFKEIINGVAVVTFTLWIYSIGIYGQDRIAELGLKPMNLKLFKANVIIVGVVLFISLFFSAIQGQVSQTTANSFELKDILYTVGGLYVTYAMVQTVIVACKTIAKIEYKREVSFGDYFNNLLLMLFFFVGIWFLQPKINRLIANEEEVAF